MIVASAMPVVTIHGRRARATGTAVREAGGTPCGDAAGDIAENDVGESAATGTSSVPGGGGASGWGVESDMRVSGQPSSI